MKRPPRIKKSAAEDIKAGKNPNELGCGETLANPGVVTRQGAKAEGLHGIHKLTKSLDVDFGREYDFS